MTWCCRVPIVAEQFDVLGTAPGDVLVIGAAGGLEPCQEASTGAWLVWFPGRAAIGRASC